MTALRVRIPDPYGKENDPSKVLWERKFIILRKINGKWIFCRYVYRGNARWYKSIGLHKIMLHIEYEYALDDFELIQKSSKK
jgi:hypothetical protein